MNKNRKPKPAPRGLRGASLQGAVREVVAGVPVIDVHTHLYDPAFGELLLWGIDDLLVYHYLVAEAFRYIDLPYEEFWALSKTEQADHIWRHLFLEHSPVSEACHGVLTTLHRLGLDARARDLPLLRKHFARWDPRDYVTRCMELANVQKIFMTNSPFDDEERGIWEAGFRRDDRFLAALRIDPLLMEWERVGAQLAQSGYEVSPDLTARTIDEVRRFLAEWTARMQARYVMVSLPPQFAFPENSPRAALIEHAVLPHCRDQGLPFALMIGVKRLVNPSLWLAGDGVGRSNMEALEQLLARFPQNKFLVTMLSRENQHELCVLARKFRNLHVFGCWWFTNIPLLVEEITRLRLELIGLSFTAQHSDARVLDQIVYKWDHSRQIIGRVLAEKYAAAAASGWVVTRPEIERDARYLLGGAFSEFLG